jgi:F0F1-type ATP synthase membrane subunit b/b'
MATGTVVPQATPATIEKQPDGTYAVRVQHTLEGSVTFVQFHNHVFGEALAIAYAAFLNGIPKFEAEIEKVVPEAGKNALADIEELKVDAESLKDEARKVLTEAKDAAAKVVIDAEAEAEKVLADAKTEAVRIIADAQSDAKNVFEVGLKTAGNTETKAAKIETTVVTDVTTEVEKL